MQTRDSLPLVAKEIIEDNGLARFPSPVPGLPVTHGTKKLDPELRSFSKSASRPDWTTHESIYSGYSALSLIRSSVMIEGILTF